MIRVEIFGKSPFEPSVQNREYCVKKLEKLERFFDYDIEVRVVCKIYPKYHKIELTLPTKHLCFRSERNGKDLYEAIDLASDVLIKQVKKHHEKVNSKMNNKSLKYDDLDKDLIVRKKELNLTPISKEEAILEMELSGHDFYLYLDEKTHKTSLLYLREDGNYATIVVKN